MAAPTIDNIVEEILPDFGVNALKPEQKEIISNITKKKDCIAVLPTGFGKSLPFQVYAAAQKRTSREAGHVLVCSPLIGLMKDQTKKLSHISYLSVGYTVESASVDEKIKRGDIDLMYASAEALVGDPEWRTAFQKLNVTLIVVDEFHTIYIWGLQFDNRKEAFRGWFAQSGELRSFYPNAPLLALSATCSLKIRKKAMKVLNLNDPAEITLSPNKSNIKLIVKKVSNSVEMPLNIMAY
ncbi:ATP-dependent DNA helicase RecQ-like [Ostrea edulis]|uniref:ATP-dependent DNA helicase RecQ-like n=1 Tax=Ostrea edulis TaxID=37623 RepID=UPI0024AFBC3B|nr:ATP-dependent DNA helicase RecQ-like [Ostrea edulis]